MRRNGTLYYLLGDHASTMLSTSLGSTSLTLNSSGTKIAELRYRAWGETRYTSGTTYTAYQFTSQRNETSLGLYFYNARWYDPSLGRFTSADTLVPGGVQGYDRYAYVNNNPVKYVDPSGHNWEDCGNRNGYQCKIHLKHVGRAKDQWARDEIQSLIQAALDHPDSSSYGLIALGAIAKYFNIHLAPGDSWKYVLHIVDPWGSGEVLGYTPRDPDEEFYGDIDNTGNWMHPAEDTAVYITSDAFRSCSSNITCIAGIMGHEAVHSWVEYKTAKNDTSEILANEELLANSVSMSLFGDPNGLISNYTSGINGMCSAYSYDCTTPLSTLQNYYGIDLTNLSVLIAP